MTLTLRRLTFALLSVFIGSMSVDASEHLEWRVYLDPAHRCRLDYPAALFSPEPRGADQPQGFSGEDESIHFRVLGLENASQWTPEDIRKNFLNIAMPGDVTYESTRNEFLVLSGYRGADIFYTRVAVSGDRRTACILDITYPRELKREFDSIVTRMSRSFGVDR